MSMRRENLPPGDDQATNRTESEPWIRPQRPARGDRGRRRPRALRLPGPVHRAAAPVPRSPQGAHRRDRRADPHRRGARLPVDRARRHVPQPQPLPRRAERRVGQRDRGHRVRRRARRALQPGRHLLGLRRGRPRGRRHAATSRRPRRTCSSRPASRPRRPSPWARIRTPPPPTRGRPASPATPGSMTTRRPRAACTTWRSSSRSAASAARPAC